jgi:hypothetical protein
MMNHPRLIGPSPPLVMAERAAEYREHRPAADLGRRLRENHEVS